MKPIDLLLWQDYKMLGEKDIILGGRSSNKTKLSNIDKMKTNEKVYLVQSSFGQYDDHYISIEGIFDNPALAEECKAKIIAEIESYKDIPEPTDIVDRDMTKEEYDVWDNWFAKSNIANDFNSCSVIEYTLNEIVK